MYCHLSLTTLRLSSHPMHFRLRTLLILLAVGPPSLYVLWLLLQLGMAINAIVEPYARSY